jgi:hypothetical protein
MIRTQIQLTGAQMEALRRLATLKKKSMANLVRQSVELYLDRESPTGDALRAALTADSATGAVMAAVLIKALFKSSLDVVGKFSSGSADGSSWHDRHLARAYR